MVHCFDLTKGTQPLFRLAAHSSACQAIALDPQVPGLLATGSPDKHEQLKIWNILNHKPSNVYSMSDETMGPVFSLNFNPEIPFILAVGTQSEKDQKFPTIINTFKYSGVSQYFGNYKGNPNPFATVQNASTNENQTNQPTNMADIFKVSNVTVSSQSSKKSKRKKKNKH